MSFHSEQVLTLSQLASREGVNLSVAWRWAQRGVGEVILETYVDRGHRFTSVEALQRFHAELRDMRRCRCKVDNRTGSSNTRRTFPAVAYCPNCGGHV